MEGDAAAPFFAKSGLPYDVLGKIWYVCISIGRSKLTNTHRDLADWNHDGRLTREEFTVAMHLVREKLNGQDLPDTLPASLIPPPPGSIGTEETSGSSSLPMLASHDAIQVQETGDQRSSTPPPPYDDGLPGT